MPNTEKWPQGKRPTFSRMRRDSLTLLGIFLVAMGLLLVSYAFFVLSARASDSLVIAGCCTLIVGTSVLLYCELGRPLKEKLADIEARVIRLGESVPKSVSPSLKGVEAIYESEGRFLSEFEKVLRHPSRELMILASPLGSFATAPHFFVELRKNLSHIEKIRTILIDPAHFRKYYEQIAGWRDWPSAEREYVAVIKNWREIESLSRQPFQVEVRTMYHLPGTRLIVADRQVYISPFLYATRSMESPVFVISDSSMTYDNCKRYFESLWIHATTL